MKSIIKRSIIRKIRTADFESIDVTEEVQQEIEWKTDAEKVKQENKVYRSLLDSFKRDLVLTMTELGLDKCIGSISTKDNKPSPKKKTTSFSEDDIDFDLLDD